MLRREQGAACISMHGEKRARSALSHVWKAKAHPGDEVACADGRGPGRQKPAGRVCKICSLTHPQGRVCKLCSLTHPQKAGIVVRHPVSPTANRRKEQHRNRNKRQNSKTVKPNLARSTALGGVVAAMQGDEAPAGAEEQNRKRDKTELERNTQEYSPDLAQHCARQFIIAGHQQAFGTGTKPKQNSNRKEI